MSPLLVQFLAGLSADWVLLFLFNPKWRSFKQMVFWNFVVTAFGQGLILFIYHMRGIR